MQSAHLTAPRALLALCTAVVLALALLPAPAAHAAEFTVDTMADTNDAEPGDGECADDGGVTGPITGPSCSLRAAVEEANALDGPDTITVPDGGGVPYALTITGADEDEAATGDLDITDDVEITGAGAGMVTIEAGALGDRIFDVRGAALDLSGVTLTGGTANEAPDDRGGAIRVIDAESSLTLDDAVIDGNTAPLAGGGIENTGGTATITDTDLTGNEATGDPMAGNGGGLHAAGGTTSVTGGTVSGNTAVEGGGLWVGAAGALTVSGTTFEDNEATGMEGSQGGGGLYAEGGARLGVTGASLTGNLATTGSGSGGAILAVETATTLTVAGSDFDENAANRAGGAIEVAMATATVDGSDFTGNDVAEGAMPGNGGALHNGGGAVTVTGGTARDNAAVEGGGFWNGGGGELDVRNVMFETNTALGQDASQGGGALYNEGAGTLTVSGSDFDDNGASTGAGSGGAILNIEAGTTLTVASSTFTGNTADRAGGAIENAMAEATITGSTFLGNRATGANSAGNGGALHDGGGDVTVSGGSAEGNRGVEGGGFWTSGTLVVTDTEFETNTATAGGALYVEEGGQLDLDGVTATDDEATDGDGNALFDNGGQTSATGSTLTSDADGLTCNVPVDGDDGGNADDDGSCFVGGVRIDRIFGSGRTETAIAISQDSFGDGEADAVVLSRPDIFPDALTGSPLAVQENGPLLLTSSDGIEAQVETEIERVLAESGTVYLLGGTAALSQQVEDDAEALGFDVVRYGGANRFDTAAIIASDGIDDPEQVLLADGSDFPDAVAAGAAAASTEGAVLLTGEDTVPPETQDYLDDNDAPLFGIGGPASRAVPEATPVFGATRIETSVEVAEEFFDAPSTVGLATAGQFPDALAGGVLVGAADGPLLLTFGDELSEPVAQYLRDEQESIDRVVLFGGIMALSESVEDAVRTIFGVTG